MTPEIAEKLAKIEAHTARIPEMDARLKRLELDRSYALGWLAGALAAGTTLGALLARVIGAL